MTTVDQAKAMAKRLRAALAARNFAVPHATALELVAAGLGHDDWNTACAALDRPADDGIRFVEAVPILRIFDEAKAREFYCGFLGFEAGFEHRFEPGLPLYMEVARDGGRPSRPAPAPIRAPWRCQSRLHGVRADAGRPRLSPGTDRQALRQFPARHRPRSLGRRAGGA